MSRTYRAWDVDQLWLLPPSVHDFVPRDHPAHLIRELAREELDLSAILAACARELRGDRPYHPAMMVALLLYAHSREVCSSRQIARACEERLDFMAMTAPQRPDVRTFSDFRKRHLAALAGLFAQVSPDLRRPQPHQALPPSPRLRTIPCRPRHARTHFPSRFPKLEPLARQAPSGDPMKQHGRTLR